MSKLPMDLSKFRKVASDKHTSTFRHYEGHEIKVAHSKLSSKMRSALDSMPLHKPKKKEQQFADGGEVQGDEFDDMVNTLNPVAALRGDKAQQKADYDAAQASLPKTSQENGGASASWEDPAPQAEGYQPAPEEAAQQVDTGPATVNAPANADPYGTLASLQQQMGGLQKVGAGEQAAEQVAGATGAQKLVQEQEYQQQRQDAAKQYEEANAPILKERQALMTDINNGHVDPKHYVNSMSTGSKISTAIGLILGGMGSGLTHGPNLAFKMLQDNIDKDIDSQKFELGKKNSLLSHNLQQTRDLRSAFDMTRIQSNDLLNSHLRAVADQTADPMAKARILQIAGMTEQKTAELQHQAALQRMATSALGGQGATNPVMAIKMLAPPAQQAGLMKDLKAKQDTDSNIQSMMHAFDTIASKNTVLNKMNPQAQSQMDAEWDPKMVKLAHESAGRFNMEELPIMNKYKPKALDTAATIAQKRQSFLDDLKSRANFPSLQPYGGGGSAKQAPAGNFGFKPRGSNGR